MLPQFWDKLTGSTENVLKTPRAGLVLFIQPTYLTLDHFHGHLVVEPPSGVLNIIVEATASSRQRVHRRSSAGDVIGRVDLNLRQDPVHTLGDEVGQRRQDLLPAEPGAGGVEGQLCPGWRCEAQNLVGLKHVEDGLTVGEGSLDGLAGILRVEGHPVDLLGRICKFIGLAWKFKQIYRETSDGTYSAGESL